MNDEDVAQDREGATAQHPTAVALMDAVDRLIASEGHAALSIRRITDEAGVAHGSIRYHFGSLEHLLVAVHGRRNEELVRRQIDLYESDLPSLEKWRIATRELHEADLASGWVRRGFEAMHLAMQNEPVRAELIPQLRAWYDLILNAVRDALDEYGIELDDRYVRGIAFTVIGSQAGYGYGALLGMRDWHEDYLDTWDALLTFLAERAGSAGDRSDPT